jgi:hypothetical protein
MVKVIPQIAAGRMLMAMGAATHRRFRRRFFTTLLGRYRFTRGNRVA